MNVGKEILREVDIVRGRLKILAEGESSSLETLTEIADRFELIAAELRRLARPRKAA